jgi:hypothetical protein
MDADLFTELEAGESREIMDDADGRPLALIRFVPRSEADYWRTAQLISPYLDEKKQYFDSRKQDYPDFFAPWQRYIEAARVAKAEILSGRKPMPTPASAKHASRAPAAAPAARPEPPEEPMMAHELQRLLREKRDFDRDR